MSPQCSNFARHWRSGIAAAVLAPALAVSGSLTAAAQDADIVLTGRAYPVGIHAGTCNELIAEPSYDLGFAQPRPIIAADGVDDGLFTTGDFYDDGDDTVIDENTAIVYEDVDGDGVLGDDEDIDDDGLFDYGWDLNDDGVLDVDEALDAPIVWSFLGDLGDVTPFGLADDDEGLFDGDDDVALEDLREIPHAIVIHQSDVTDLNYLACGEIEGVSINDEVVVPLLPVGQNGLTGVAIMEAGADGFLGIGGDAGLANVHAWPRQAPLSAEALMPPPTPTPEPTATPEPTPTPVVVEIPTEFTVELRDEDINPAEFTILANTDTELTLSNLTTEARTFFIDGLDVSQELPPGETISITVNAPAGEYGYGIVEDEAIVGTLRVLEQAE